jgi:hypothetical protein
MGNRDRRDDKVRKPKKEVKQSTARIEVTDTPPPVEVVKKKRRKEDV